MRESRIIVVGGGVAGLACALEAESIGTEVLIVAPRDAYASATRFAQGGIAAAMGAGDSGILHGADTLRAGAGLADRRAVAIVAEQAPGAVRWLRDAGLPLDPSPRREGGHGRARVHQSGDDAIGRALTRTLRTAVERRPSILWMDAKVTELSAGGSGRVSGVVTGSGTRIGATRVVLATGGAAAIHPRHTGPSELVGEGIAMAFRAGAFLADLEFVQFHPTALAIQGRPATLLTEALRGAGARLIDASGRPFMPRWHPMGDLAPRDIVSLAAWHVGTVFLDASRVQGVTERFPGATERCAEAGLDIETEPIPVAPAAHYTMGGVLTDGWGRTTVPGLLACGEVACTGVHGANRLGSNSLAEALVLGRRTAHAAAAPMPAPQIERRLEAKPRAHVPTLAETREIAGRCLGVVRDHAGLTEAASLPASPDAPAPVLVAALTAAAALMREESRGSHFRSDFPFARLDPTRSAVSRDGWATLRTQTGA